MAERAVGVVRAGEYDEPTAKDLERARLWRVEACALVLEVSPDHVCRLIRSGDLRAFWENRFVRLADGRTYNRGRWRVLGASVYAYLERRVSNSGSLAQRRRRRREAMEREASEEAAAGGAPREEEAIGRQPPP